MPLSGVCVSTFGGRPRLWSSHSNLRVKDRDAAMSGEDMATTGYCYDFGVGAVVPKKDKKWSLGSLFRRGKKRDESASSSDEERRGGGFLGRRRRKSDGKRKKPKPLVTFDHVVHPRTASYNGYHNTRQRDDPGILSDPSGGFRTYSRTTPARGASPGSSADSIARKSKKDSTKARAAARRTALGHESSSDEADSQRSTSSLRIRSDESLAGSYSRKSRAARTERYLKRHSRDGENPHHYLKLSKSDADKSPSRSPNPPPSAARVSNSTSNPSYKPPLSMNEYNGTVRRTGEEEEENRVIHVRFPIVRPRCDPPPQPPPRDPNRSVAAARPTTCYFDTDHPSKPFGYRSNSEMHLPNEATIHAVRPASATPEPTRHRNKYRYLTDKSPRSRKPILIRAPEARKESTPTQDALDFWKRIEEDVNRTCGPRMFTGQTRVHSRVILPDASRRDPSPFESVDEANRAERKSSNLEDALDELEAIYNSLRLGDEDLLERAEQKEREAAERRARESRRGGGATSDSGFSYEPFERAPRRRRDKMPDTEHDDMYNRKLAGRKKSATIGDPQSVIASVSYLLASPAHQGVDETDAITRDDLLYRNVKRSLSSPKTVEPQPPFGIPLGPVSAAPNSDYLHATPVNLCRPTPRPIPDVVKDDLAFRNLRKDPNKEPALPNKLDLNYLKKRRAVRSLSANIGTLLGVEPLDIAKKVLEEKSTTNGDIFKESRLRFLDGLKGTAPTSPSLDDLLDSLAIETKITTDRIAKELEELEEGRKQIEAVEETVEPMTLEPVVAETANLVQSCVVPDVESDHDYENVESDRETSKCRSPFEERKGALVATFQELKRDLDEIRVPRFDNKTDSVYDNLEGADRTPLPRWSRPLSCPDEAVMSSNRRDSSVGGGQKPGPAPQQDTPTRRSGGATSGSEGPRPTRASKLRAQVALGHYQGAGQQKTEKGPPSESRTSPASPRNKADKDKSHKRKSNLNRSLTSEEVPQDDAKSLRRRARRFFPPEVLDRRDPTDCAEKARAATSAASSSSSSSPQKSSAKRSELSAHMENARRVVANAASDRYRPFSKRPVPRGDKENRGDATISKSDNETNRDIARRMEELTAFTRETLARVERLANRNKTAPGPSSILKKKAKQEKQVVVATEATSSVPVSILKRKVVQEDKTGEPATSTPPVTFSPSVVEPATTNRKQGILKKRRSLDESTVTRHRSCSPDIVNQAKSSADSKSILKNQRRSSLEELRRTRSPETHLHGILKRKTSRHEDEDHSLNSPASILKRRSGASSAGSTGSTPHVSITTAVILAAAEGAEMVLQQAPSAMRPILKKKSSSDEYAGGVETPTDATAPRPILKKKSSSETDDATTEDKPRPILKQERSDGGETRPILKTSLRSESPRPRLSFCGEASSSVDEARRARTSRRSHTICSDYNVASNAMGREKDEDRTLTQARPLSVLELVRSFEKTISAPRRSTPSKRTGDRYKTQPITSDELERSLNLVNLVGGSPRRENVHEGGSSYHPHRSSALSTSSRSLDDSSHPLVPDFSSSLREDGGGLTRFLSSSSSFQADESPTHHKTSSDSAFQSLGDGLELEREEATEEGEMLRPDQMKAIAEEAKRKRQDFGERRGILKPESTSSLPRRSRSFAAPGSKKRESAFVDFAVEAAAAEKDDEGISCNFSGSDSETSEAKAKPATSSRRIYGGDDTASEGESSGGREVRKIFGGNDLGFRRKLEGALSTSRSHASFHVAGGGGARWDAPSSAEHRETSTGKPSSASSGLRRSHTHTAGAMPRSIADLKAKLQERGERDWMKRVQVNNNSCDELKLLKEKNRYNDELSEKSVLAARKDELDAASRQWKTRVEKSDAEKFSVAGKMGVKVDKESEAAPPTINIPATDNKKRTPQAKRYKGKDDPSSTPSSPEKNKLFDLTRSKSALYPAVFAQEKTDADTTSKISSRVVSVTKPDDETFRTFFESVELKTWGDASLNVDPADFDAVERHSLLVAKKNVRVQRRRGATRNPIKALASRSDIADEYTEVITGVAEREKKRLNIEKLALNSNKAVEALAGLASNEDFKAVALKKGSGPTTLLPWKSPMLFQIKGRRHVQTRLVEPAPGSVNEGDCFVLVTPGALYSYVGAYSNVIEQARASDVAAHIQKTGDMGCNVAKIVAVSNKSPGRHLEAFWRALGSDTVPETVGAGHPDEDETYETNILNTNMIYRLEGDELAPYDRYWGAVPKIQMLKEQEVIVFDFGSEMYVWSGKNAPLEKKRLALKLARDMWDEGYNYVDCDVCPLNVASVLGDRKPAGEPAQKASKRPDWALFCRITQHRETILFTEKFLDWPHFSRVIRARGADGGNKSRTPSIEIKPCNVDEMAKVKDSEPDLVVGDVHLGRGHSYFDDETRRLFSYETLEIVAWRIMENTHERLDANSVGQFYDGDSYIYSWKFRQTVKGRELNGKPSKHAPVGKDRCIFFCWHGAKSSVNEKCLAAFLTVELDKQNAPQVRVTQGAEPAAFLRLFGGAMVIHLGKRNEAGRGRRPRLFLVRGEMEDEIYLMEVPAETDSLRSRTSFALFDLEHATVTVWHGAKASEQKRRVAMEAVRKIVDAKPSELFPEEFLAEVAVTETEESGEGGDFLDRVPGGRERYLSLANSDDSYDHTPRLFKMSSTTGSFVATEVLCPHRSRHVSPYPFVQSDLYSASQPVLFLFDNGHELWLWQGWWPETEEEADLAADQTGSGRVRWQAERRAAMQTAVAYWKKTRDDDRPVVAYLVWAGLEPTDFRNLFPAWEERCDAAEANTRDGRTFGEKPRLESVLARLSRTTYPLVDILRRPLPEGVDPTQLEVYLSNADFEELLSMSREEFRDLPPWKRTALKKEKGLF
ncbi:supervillin-like isoform X2 [Cylas formicarius]|uniref:supervillin-like isoform X2 n=1 Tax=Cylas formicarius TaxID=197179 RepID=UPI002958A374|nr:supervillin-like isoform X2 [Cylas formicarius]